jgi:large subunit ribosomal protein L21e
MKNKGERMGDTSKGFRRRTRKILKKRIKDRGISPVTRSFPGFNSGDRAAIVLDPGVHAGMPHPRFNGKTGIITGKRGEAFIIRVRDGGKYKEIISRPEHLRRIT